MFFYRYAVWCVLALAFSACTQVRLDNQAGEKHQYFGYVEVIVPKKEKKIQALKVQSVGVAIENGISVGWRDKEMVLVPLKEPADGSAPYEATCSIVMIVRSTPQAAHAAELLRTLKGENICLASFE